jgi:hypothetical protein
MQRTMYFMSMLRPEVRSTNSLSDHSTTALAHCARRTIGARRKRSVAIRWLQTMAVWRRVLRALHTVLIWFMLAFVLGFILLADVIQRIASWARGRAGDGLKGVGRYPGQRKTAFAHLRAPQSLSGTLSELAARNRLPDRIQEISHAKRFLEELEAVLRGKLHRPHVPGDHYDRQPHALGVKSQLRAWLAGYPAIENDHIDLGSVASQDLPHGGAAICWRRLKPGDIEHFDEYGANVRIVVYHKDMQCHGHRPVQREVI